jgi:hypothetical protein
MIIVAEAAGLPKREMSVVDQFESFLVASSRNPAQFSCLRDIPSATPVDNIAAVRKILRSA